MINRQKIKNCHAYSIIEIVVALGIFAVLVSVLFIHSLDGLVSLDRSSHYMRALMFLNEGEEAVRAIAKTDWDSLAYSQSSLGLNYSAWVLTGEGTGEDLGDYFRTIYFYSVYRNNNNAIIESNDPDASLDEHSRYADIYVDWHAPGQRDIVLTKKILLTHYYASTSPSL